MEDVARAAGVDKATVSRALKGDRRISAATRERVWAEARALGYRLDVAASSLSGGRTGLVAVVAGALRPWIAPSFFSGLHRVVSRQNLEILLKITEFSGRDILGPLLARHVECIAWLDGGFLPEAEEVALPLIAAGSVLQGRPAVLLSEEETLRELQGAADGRPIFLSAGPHPLFPFLARYLPMVPSKKPDGAFVVYDGVPPDQEGAGCLCAMPEEPSLKGFYRLEWPGYTMGVSLGRLLVTSLQGRLAVPVETMVPPTLLGPGG